jgi:hypothetical protein
MTEGVQKEPKVMPKGGRKGGRRFPQYPLNDAVKWAEKLVSKTHGGPQPDDLIKAGVVEAKSGAGDMRISALKQFDLMDGTSKGYSATDLAKELRSAPDEEKRPLHIRAALNPEVFNAIYETYQGDSVSAAKLKQRAADLQVHPDASSKCVDVYIETMEFAGLVSRNGDTLIHVAKGDIATAPSPESGIEEEVSDKVQELTENDNMHDQSQGSGGTSTKRGVATVQVNITVDSTLDTDKLQRQLELLRRFGAL